MVTMTRKNRHLVEKKSVGKWKTGVSGCKMKAMSTAPAHTGPSRDMGHWHIIPSRVTALPLSVYEGSSTLPLQVNRRTCLWQNMDHTKLLGELLRNNESRLCRMTGPIVLRSSVCRGAISS